MTDSITFWSPSHPLSLPSGAFQSDFFFFSLFDAKPRTKGVTVSALFCVKQKPCCVGGIDYISLYAQTSALTVI